MSDYPAPCPECGSDIWLMEMGESMNLRHYRSCSQWHWYFDGGPHDGTAEKPFGHPFNTRQEAAASLAQSFLDKADEDWTFIDPEDVKRLARAVLNK